MTSGKKFNNTARQGDIYIQRIDALPAGLKEVNPEEGRQVVAHSETGHHHAFDVGAVNNIDALMADSILNGADTLDKTEENNIRVFMGDDPGHVYVVVQEPADLVHHRSFDTHEAISFPSGVFKINRQREKVPDGWRQVMD